MNTWKEVVLPIVFAVMALAVSWGAFTNRIEVLEARAQVLEARLEQKDDQFLSMYQELGKISTNIEWIKLKLEKGK